MKRSLKQIAAVVSLGTLLSKAGGMARQLVIAGAFGVGAAYDAYNYAYVIPGFFLVIIGGINGPLHNSIVTVLSKRNTKDRAYILSSINTSLSFLLIIASGILFFASDPIVKILGPSLNNEVHNIAVKQLQIMSPISLLAGLIGIGFGTLNASNIFFLPSIAPILSSLALIIGAGAFWVYSDQTTPSFEVSLTGGIILAQASLIGASLQWIIQIPSLVKKGFLRLKPTWDWKHPGVQEVWAIIIPAILASGMLQVNVITDLFFASSIVGAAAGLGYANFLIQAPLGLISNTILIPLLPTLAKLSKPEDKFKFIKKVRKGFMISSASMISLGAIFMALGTPIVDLIYGRGAFDYKAINLVSGLIIAYGIGMPAYLSRDLLVRTFYSLGDAKTPFRLSSAGIIINIFLDWLFIGGPSPWGNQFPINFGAKGIVLATVGVNIFTCIGLLLKLKRRFKFISIKEWSIDLSKLLICGIVSGSIAWLINLTLIPYPGFIWHLSKVIFASSISIFIFLILGRFLRIEAIDDLVNAFNKNTNRPQT